MPCPYGVADRDAPDIGMEHGWLVTVSPVVLAIAITGRCGPLEQPTCLACARTAGVWKWPIEGPQSYSGWAVSGPSRKLEVRSPGQHYSRTTRQ